VLTKIAGYLMTTISLIQSFRRS